MELKGIITQGEKRSLTCCNSIEDILIGNVSLFDKLEYTFNLDSERFWNDSRSQSPQYGVKFVILDEEPTEDKNFADQSAETVMNMMYAEHINGCYSEWTCGMGGFDYINGASGHSIFKELKGSIGKYIHFKI